jgi:hypothetical protein
MIFNDTIVSSDERRTEWSVPGEGKFALFPTPGRGAEQNDGIRRDPYRPISIAHPMPALSE